MIKYIGLFFGLFLLCACSGPGAEEPELPEHIRDLENLTVYPYEPGEVPEIELIREMTFGSTEEHIIGALDRRLDPMDPVRVFKTIAADDEGRVYIGDSQQQTVHVYRPDGTWLTDLGRQGRGPGEFQNVSELDVISNRLYLIDNGQREVEVFDLVTLEHSHSMSLIPKNQSGIEEVSSMFPYYYYIRSDESVLTGFKKIHFQLREDPGNPGLFLFYVMDQNGNIQPQKILEQKPSPIFFNGPLYYYFSFIPTSIRALSNDDHIYAAWTEDFLIKVYSPGGEYLRAFYYPFEKREIVRSELNRRGQLEGEVIASMDLPESWPALRSMFVDDEDRLWVSTFLEEAGATSNEWWVLNSDGAMLGRLHLSEHQQLHEVKDGMVYTVESEEAFGEQVVVRYRIEMEE